MLHTCQGCGEAWADYFIKANRTSFDVDPKSKEVTACPSCKIDDSAVEHVTYEDDHIVSRRDVSGKLPPGHWLPSRRPK
jgi:hypothetical protein